MKKPLTTSSSSVSDNFILNDIITPKSILKKFNQQSLPIYTKTSPLIHRPPKPIPRTTIKQ
jgi:hypothetical protein